MAHEAVLIAQEKKRLETRQNVADAQERERAKLIRTVALQHQDHIAESQKEIRRLEKEWQKVCGALQKALGSEQLQVVRIQLELVRVKQGAREKEETLQRQASAAHQACSVSASFYHHASIPRFYTHWCILTLLYARFYHRFYHECKLLPSRFYTTLLYSLVYTHASILTLLSSSYSKFHSVSIGPFLFYDLHPFGFRFPLALLEASKPIGQIGAK